MVLVAAILLAAAPHPAVPLREMPDFLAPTVFRERATPKPQLSPVLQARVHKVLDRIDVSGSAVCWKMRW